MSELKDPTPTETVVQPKQAAAPVLTETIVAPRVLVEENISSANTLIKGTVQRVIDPAHNSWNLPPEPDAVPAPAKVFNPTVAAPREAPSPPARELKQTIPGSPPLSPQPQARPLKGTVIKQDEYTASADVISLESARMPADLLVEVDEAHAAFKEWNSAGQLEKDDAKDTFLACIRKIEEWLEVLSLTTALEPAERLAIISHIIFGKSPAKLTGHDVQILAMFKEVQSLENPDGEYGDPVTAILERMEKLDFCFGSEDSEAMMIALLQVDIWGSRDSQKLMADLARERGYSTRQVLKLGEGAMGKVVRLLKDPSMGENEELALKYSTIGQDLTREGKISAKASASGAGLRTIESTRPDKAIFMVYEKGAQDFEGVFASEIPFSPALMAQTAEQLGKLHAAGIIHRDLKPANIMVLENGTQPKIIDYGLALDAEEEEDPYADKLIGTLAYMSPEASSGQYTASTDVYALGCIAFEWATGQAWIHRVRDISRPPIGGETAWSGLRRTNDLANDEELFQEALNKIPSDKPKLRAAIEKTLHPNAEKRAQTAQKAAELFTACASEFAN